MQEEYSTMPFVLLILSMLFIPSPSTPVHHHHLQPQCGYCPTPHVKPPIAFPPTAPVPIPPTVPSVPLPPVPLPPRVPGIPIPPRVPGVPLPPSLVPPRVPKVPPPALPPKGIICPPPARMGGTCPINTLKLGGCVDLLGGLVHGIVGGFAVHECCPIMSGLVEIEAATCLCTTLKMKAMNVNVYLPLVFQLLISCGKTPPPGFTCY